MTNLLLAIAALALGFVILVKGANWLVDGAVAIARRLHISPLIVGLTIVAFGTSAPELAVNMLASASGATQIVFGNIIGSNIANIGLILGIAALIRPIKVHSEVLVREIPLMILGSLVLLIMVADRWLDSQPALISRSDGLIMLAFFAIFFYALIITAVRQRHDASSGGNDKVKESQKLNTKRSVLMVLMGLAALIIGGRLVVDQAATLARLAGWSEAFIGLTIVAIGTSLPELVTSIVAARKGESDIALGNVVGSNIFNILFILGLSAVIHPIASPEMATVDVGVMIGFAILVWMFATTDKLRIIKRWHGGTLLGLFALYMVFLCIRG